MTTCPYLRHALAAAGALALVACCCPFSPPSQPAPVPVTIVAPPTQPGPPTGVAPPTVPSGQSAPTGTVIAPGPGGGGYQVTVDGQPVWPPQGPGCDQYVRCCEAAGRAQSAIDLACRLTVSRQPVDCGRALASIRQMMTEMNVPPQAECGP